MNNVLLPQMVRVSNNSRLTADVTKVLTDKLSPSELRDFQYWLKIVEHSQQQNKRRYV